MLGHEKQNGRDGRCYGSAGLYEKRNQMGIYNGGLGRPLSAVHESRVGQDDENGDRPKGSEDGGLEDVKARGSSIISATFTEPALEKKRISFLRQPRDIGSIVRCRTVADCSFPTTGFGYCGTEGVKDGEEGTRINVGKDGGSRIGSASLTGSYSDLRNANTELFARLRVRRLLIEKLEETSSQSRKKTSKGIAKTASSVLSASSSSLKRPYEQPVDVTRRPSPPDDVTRIVPCDDVIFRVSRDDDVMPRSADDSVTPLSAQDVTRQPDQARRSDQDDVAQRRRTGNQASSVRDSTRHTTKGGLRSTETSAYSNSNNNGVRPGGTTTNSSSPSMTQQQADGRTRKSPDDASAGQILRKAKLELPNLLTARARPKSEIEIGSRQQKQELEQKQQGSQLLKQKQPQQRQYRPSQPEKLPPEVDEIVMSEVDLPIKGRDDASVTRTRRIDAVKTNIEPYNDTHNTAASCGIDITNDTSSHTRDVASSALQRQDIVSRDWSTAASTGASQNRYAAQIVSNRHGTQLKSNGSHEDVAQRHSWLIYNGDAVACVEAGSKNVTSCRNSVESTRQRSSSNDVVRKSLVGLDADIRCLLKKQAMGFEAMAILVQYLTQYPTKRASAASRVSTANCTSGIKKHPVFAPSQREAGDGHTAGEGVGGAGEGLRELASLRQELNEVKQRNGALLAESMTLRRQLNDATLQLNEARRHANDVTTQKTTQLLSEAARRAALTAQMDDVTRQLNDVTREKNALLGEVDALRRQHADAKNFNDVTMTAEITRNDDVIEELKRSNEGVLMKLKRNHEKEMDEQRLSQQIALDEQRRTFSEQLNSLQQNRQLEIQAAVSNHETRLDKLRVNFREEIDSLNCAHKLALDNLDSTHRVELENVNSTHESELETIRFIHQMELDNREKLVNTLTVEHAATVAKLEKEHAAEVERLQSHQIMALETCNREISDLKRRLEASNSIVKSGRTGMQTGRTCSASGESRETKRTDSSFLEQEVESLRAVVDLRTGELGQQRQRNAIIEKQLEEIPVLRETIVKQKQEIENLTAVIDIRADYERELAEKHQGLLRKAERDSKALKRLSMNNEELVWRINQSDVNINRNSEVGELDEDTISALNESDSFSTSMCQLPIGQSGIQSKHRLQRPKSMVVLQNRTSTVASTEGFSRGSNSPREPPPQMINKQLEKSTSFNQLHSLDGGSCGDRDNNLKLRRPRLLHRSAVTVLEPYRKTVDNDSEILCNDHDLKQSDV